MLVVVVVVVVSVNLLHKSSIRGNNVEINPCRPRLHRPNHKFHIFSSEEGKLVLLSSDILY